MGTPRFTYPPGGSSNPFITTGTVGIISIDFETTPSGYHGIMTWDDLGNVVTTIIGSATPFDFVS